MTAGALLESDCPDLQLVARGKVRDLYRIDENTLLFVATDRISAFDVIMKNGIPGKGKVLTQISVFWFAYLADIIPNHLITTDFDKMPEKVKKYKKQLEHRSLLVKNLQVFKLEAIVRGYITGSAWSEYKQSGTICGIPLPEDLEESQQFPDVLFTPSTKADIGQHDENIHPSKVAEIVGTKYAKEISETSIKLYNKAKDYALTKGIIIADTKFEFGVDSEGTLYIVDEVLTPDSSRFWPASKYKIGQSQKSFDKQSLRDYLTSIKHDRKTSILLPDEIVKQIMEKYMEVYTLLTGAAPNFL
ncbi:hypothetical protein G9A89_009684 [Geosiphon pyriformis]|nr:hypothetical protein G9A89_009684 [Geosiphon pyriformis]